MVVPSSSSAARARDAARQVEVEKEVLAEALACIQPVPGNGLAQRRQGRHAVHPQLPRRRAMSSAMARAAIRLVGSARPVPAMSSAVPWSGDVRTNGRAERDVDAAGEVDRLDRDQRLVVIHAERGVIGRARAAGWNSVSAGAGPRTSMPSARSVSIAGRITRDLLVAHRSPARRRAD